MAGVDAGGYGLGAVAWGSWGARGRLGGAEPPLSDLVPPGQGNVA